MYVLLSTSVIFPRHQKLHYNKMEPIQGIEFVLQYTPIAKAFDNI